jgi:hypothetical protein
MVVFGGIPDLGVEHPEKAIIRTSSGMRLVFWCGRGEGDGGADEDIW